MSSSISFGGKCATVLIGAGLSWLTVSNPDIDQAIGKLFGTNASNLSSDAPNLSLAQVDLDTPLIDVAETTANVAQPEPNTEQGVPTSSRATERLNERELDVEEMATRLRSLGASYLLLERLPQQAGDQFRARCDLAASGDSVKCCFEAVRNTPEQAMAEVLQAVVAAQSTSVPPQGNVLPSATSI